MAKLYGNFSFDHRVALVVMTTIVWVVVGLSLTGGYRWFAMYRSCAAWQNPTTANATLVLAGVMTTFAVALVTMSSYMLYLLQQVEKKVVPRKPPPLVYDKEDLQFRHYERFGNRLYNQGVFNYKMLNEYSATVNLLPDREVPKTDCQKPTEV